MRIISLSPSTTEIIYAIGKGEEIVGNTYLCDYPEQAKHLPHVGSWTDINLDKVADLKPDIIFTSTVVQHKLSTQLQKDGYQVHHSDPRSLQNIFEDILVIGEKIDAKKEAQRVVKEMKAKITSLGSKIKKQKPKVYVEEWYDPPMVSGNWVPDIITLAGGEYTFVNEGEASRVVTLEEVQHVNPDIILLAYCGAGKNSNPKNIIERNDWQNIPAIKNKKIFSIDESLLNRPGPRIVDVLEEIQKLLSS